MIIALSIIILLGFVVFIYLKLPKFGKNPSGERLLIMQKSPNFKNGKVNKEAVQDIVHSLMVINPSVSAGRLS
jgi:hypothetical protein